MKAQRVKITQPGWTTFNGQLYGFQFKDGISEEALPPSVVRQLGASICVQTCDDGAQAGAGTDAIHNQNIKAPVGRSTAEVETAPKSAKPAAEATESAEEGNQYSREFLEKVADERGIGGLRDIAAPLGLKGRSIHELIDQIVKHGEGGQ